MVRLERLGIPTAAVATEPFIDEALEQARVLGMPDYRMVFIPHPVQLLTLEQLHERADRVFDLIVARLSPAYAATGSSSGRSSSA
jgi:hypothetical protein